LRGATTRSEALRSEVNANSRTTQQNFGRGLVATLVASLVGVWLILHWETALLCMMVIIATLQHIEKFYYRVRNTFDFDENTEAIDLSDIFAGPANIVGVASNTLSNATRITRGMRNVADRELRAANNGRGRGWGFFSRGGGESNFEEEDRRLMAQDNNNNV